MLYSKCIVCGKVYNQKEDGKKEKSYSHGYCGKKCVRVSKEITKKGSKNEPN